MLPQVFGWKGDKSYARGVNAKYDSGICSIDSDSCQERMAFPGFIKEFRGFAFYGDMILSGFTEDKISDTIPESG